MPSTITAFTPIAERSEATPGLWNRRFQQLQDNIASINTTYDIGVYNVTAPQFGAVGNGVQNDRDRIAAADAAAVAAGAGAAVLFPAGVYLVSTALTITSPVIFLPGSMISMPSGVTVTLSHRDLRAGLGHVFGGAGGVVLNGRLEMIPEWWGAGTASDDAPAIQKAMDAGSRVRLTNRVYTTQSTLSVHNNITIEGYDRWESCISYAGLGDALKSDNPYNGSLYAEVTLRNFRVDTSRSTNSGAALRFSGAASYWELENLHIRGLYKYGIIFDQTEVAHVKSCLIENSNFTGGANVWITNGDEYGSGEIGRAHV